MNGMDGNDHTYPRPGETCSELRRHKVPHAGPNPPSPLFAFFSCSQRPASAKIRCGRRRKSTKIENQGRTKGCNSPPHDGRCGSGSWATLLGRFRLAGRTYREVAPGYLRRSVRPRRSGSTTGQVEETKGQRRVAGDGPGRSVTERSTIVRCGETRLIRIPDGRHEFFVQHVVTAG